jgi:pimeloyl-ACP methyl ester carboxylesterase
MRFPQISVSVHVRTLLAALGRSGLAIKRPEYFEATAGYLQSLGATVDLRALPGHRQGNTANYACLARTCWKKFSGQVEQEVRTFSDELENNVLFFGHCFGSLTLLVVMLRLILASEGKRAGGLISVAIPVKLHWWGRLLFSMSRLLCVLPFLRWLPIPNPFSDSWKISKWLPANIGLLIREAFAELEMLLGQLAEMPSVPSIRVLFVHGGKDSICLPSGSKELAGRLGGLGMETAFALLPEEGHDVMSNAGNPDFGDTNYEAVIRKWIEKEERLAASRAD